MGASFWEPEPAPNLKTQNSRTLTQDEELRTRDQILENPVRTKTARQEAGQRQHWRKSPGRESRTLSTKHDE